MFRRVKDKVWTASVVMMVLPLMLLVVLSMVSNRAIADSLCKGHFVNPIKDVCWSCIFPITIGNNEIVSGSDKHGPDTPNPSNPICLCPLSVGWRVGLAIGFWEPFELVDVTRDPYCMVNLGGFRLIKHSSDGIGGKDEGSEDTNTSFYYVHEYKYPITYLFNLITSLACVQSGDMDIAYMTELDPMWNNSELTAILQPEAVLFGNLIAQSACAADSLATIAGSPKDSLFWCMGSQGTVYPLDGFVGADKSPIQAATLLAEKMEYKLHREGLVEDSTWHAAPALCYQHYRPIMPKSRYRYEMVNSVAEGDSCHPFGHTVSGWEAGHNYPGEGDNFGFLIFRKRNCCFL